jgi:hypothetical protein
VEGGDVLMLPHEYQLPISFVNRQIGSPRSDGIVSILSIVRAHKVYTVSVNTNFDKSVWSEEKKYLRIGFEYRSIQRTD